NNPVDTAKGERQPARYLAKEQLLGAADEVCALVVGEAVDLAKMLVPTAGIADPARTPVESESAYLRALTEEGAAGPELAGVPDRVQVSGWSWLFWGKPSEAALDERARAFEASLRAAFPDRRYVVVW